MAFRETVSTKPKNAPTFGERNHLRVVSVLEIQEAEQQLRRWLFLGAFQWKIAEAAA